MELSQQIRRESGDGNERERERGKWIELRKPQDKWWLNTAEDAANLMSQSFLKNLELIEKQNKEGMERTHPPLPCGLLYGRAIPSASGVELMTSWHEEPIDRELVWYSRVEFCGPHLWVLGQPYLCKMDTQLFQYVHLDVGAFVWCGSVRPVNWDKWLCRCLQSCDASPINRFC